MVTGIAVFLLLLYKGIHFMVFSSVSFSYTIEQIDELLYGGSIAIRSALYAGIHTVYGITTLLYSIPIFKSLKN